MGEAAARRVRRFEAMSFRFAFGRPPAVAAEVMVATSQPLATRAALRMLERGGNAADAAVAAAAMLCVTEPMSTGLGGDAFAIVSRDGRIEGLDAAGPAPANADPVEPVADRGPRSVDVPGAVAGWAALCERHGRLGLDACLADAIDAAERGFAVAARTAAAWQPRTTNLAWTSFDLPPEFAPAPEVGTIVRFPEMARTLRAIAEDGPDALYRSEVARAICEVSWLEESDLADYRPRWVEPLRLDYRGVEVLELPPPTQGVAALEALGILRGLEPTLPNRVAAAALALEDARAHVRDGADVSFLLEEGHLARRRSEVPRPTAPVGGGTVYLCAVDGERTAVSFIQSIYASFGSGIVAPGTGVLLQNRGSCFSVQGRVEPGKRPYHTIIPGMLLQDGDLLGPFGVMGGFIQAQAHMQLVSALVDDALDPQAALDRPRFRVEDGTVLLEEGLWLEAEALEQAGHVVVREPETSGFGGGQAILVRGDALVGGSDPRKDGYAAGF
jgi:gamma-glutamyltranspeptidase/glutathione hydrolase